MPTPVPGLCYCTSVITFLISVGVIKSKNVGLGKNIHCIKPLHQVPPYIDIKDAFYGIVRAVNEFNVSIYFIGESRISSYSSRWRLGTTLDGSSFIATIQLTLIKTTTLPTISSADGGSGRTAR